MDYRKNLYAKTRKMYYFIDFLDSKIALGRLENILDYYPSLKDKD